MIRYISAAVNPVDQVVFNNWWIRPSGLHICLASFDPEDGSENFLRSVELPANYKMPQLRRP
jgi:hypothetical protein